jgi:hypothetical protein
VVRRGQEIDAVIDYLADVMDRIQLLGRVPSDVVEKASATRAALRLYAKICDYLTTAIKILKHGDLGSGSG